MNRFFIDPINIDETTITVPDDISAQIRKVLRLKEGAIVQFLDNRGWIYDSMIHYYDEKNLYAEIINKNPAQGEPECLVSLYIGITQREKFEWILQKCTEAGVSNIIPMITERSLIRRPVDIESKQERWEKIIKEASEQCGRGRIPILSSAMTFQEAVYSGIKSDVSILCWEQEKRKTLRNVLSEVHNTAGKVSVMIGPEGGISDAEALLAVNAGWLPVTLGKRIYRMETAALASVILILYEMEN